jgi:hypothetical protein
MRLTVIILLLAVLPAIAAKVPADGWQTGTLKDSSESWHSRTVGTVNASGGLLVGRDYPVMRYVIDAGSYSYEAELALRHRHDKQPSVTVNGSIKFAILESDFYIQDEQSKEFKLVLVKKTLNAAQTVDQK